MAMGLSTHVYTHCSTKCVPGPHRLKLFSSCVRKRSLFEGLKLPGCSSDSDSTLSSRSPTREQNSACDHSMVKTTLCNRCVSEHQRKGVSRTMMNHSKGGAWGSANDMRCVPTGSRSVFRLTLAYRASSGWQDMKVARAQCNKP